MIRFFLIISVVCFTNVKATDSIVNKIPTDYSTCLVISDEYHQHHFLSEIAGSAQKRQIGMMFRSEIKNSQAMLFVFNEPKALAFWMKNVQMPLDMLFFDAQRKLIEIKSNVPPCQSNVCPTYPAQNNNNKYVLELQGGNAEKLEIKIGAKLSNSEKTAGNCHDET